MKDIGITKEALETIVSRGYDFYLDDSLPEDIVGLSKISNLFKNWKDFVAAKDKLDGSMESACKHHGVVLSDPKE